MCLWAHSQHHFSKGQAINSVPGSAILLRNIEAHALPTPRNPTEPTVQNGRRFQCGFLEKVSIFFDHLKIKALGVKNHFVNSRWNPLGWWAGAKFNCGTDDVCDGGCFGAWENMVLQPEMEGRVSRYVAYLSQSQWWQCMLTNQFHNFIFTTSGQGLLGNGWCTHVNVSTSFQKNNSFSCFKVVVPTTFFKKPPFTTCLPQLPAQYHARPIPCPPTTPHRPPGGVSCLGFLNFQITNKDFQNSGPYFWWRISNGAVWD